MRLRTGARLLGLLGVARTVRADSVRSFEYVRIEERDGKLFYVAQPGGRPPGLVARIAGDTAGSRVDAEFSLKAVSCPGVR
jgi:hypothetical protein